MRINNKKEYIEADKVNKGQNVVLNTQKIKKYNTNVDISTKVNGASGGKLNYNA